MNKSLSFCVLVRWIPHLAKTQKHSDPKKVIFKLTLLQLQLKTFRTFVPASQSYYNYCEYYLTTSCSRQFSNSTGDSFPNSLEAVYLGDVYVKKKRITVV